MNRVKNAGLVALVALGALIPAAHLNRWYSLWEALGWLAPAVCLIFTRRESVRRVNQVLALAGSLLTVDTMLHFVRLRQAMGAPWLRLAVILGVAALVTALAAWVLEHPLFARNGNKDGGAGRRNGRDEPGAGSTAGGAGMSVNSSAQDAPWAGNDALEAALPRTLGAPHIADLRTANRRRGDADPLSGASARPDAGEQQPKGIFREFPAAGFAAWGITLALLAVVQLKVRPPMLLAERFAQGAGWLEISLLALYAGFLAETLCDPKRAPKARRRAWGLFSLVFFGQLALGLAGFKDFLMTGALHLPVPALIVAGPLFRGEGLFMLVLFSATVLLVGPAWCSHLCYIGAWDSAMSQARKRPASAPAWLRRGRILLAAAVFAVAWGLGRMGVPVLTAVWLAAAFGLAGVGIMAFASRRMGVMAHCTGWCPMGLLAGLAGKLSPWRLTIGSGCKGCGVCSRACRYDALRPEDLARKRPGVSCSLCRDCLGTCPKSEMELTFLGRSGPWVWVAFSVLVAGLHAVFLGVARI
ncbi:4Fe-4S binding protein [Fundidesulfovibrio agrisoli]|uniref:4Fe-4S binding protein n=1 Tax=Fundidesulfovibrio agrisoli TaxID=2922717 RepID=UPI001FABADE3|nr:4Fe-4S binding protein [Fundidesulfovibrio agrisoli]